MITKAEASDEALKQVFLETGHSFNMRVYGMISETVSDRNIYNGVFETGPGREQKEVETAFDIALGDWGLGIGMSTRCMLGAISVGRYSGGDCAVYELCIGGRDDSR